VRRVFCRRIVPLRAWRFVLASALLSQDNHDSPSKRRQTAWRGAECELHQPDCAGPNAEMLDLSRSGKSQGWLSPRHI
jgi:hypothetical protein